MQLLKQLKGWVTLSKMKSLSLKLVIFYTISVVIIVVAILSYIEFSYARESEDAARDRMEFGPGYINGATPSDYNNLATL